MKILVIHPKDSSTDFLKEIYKYLNCEVVDSNISKSKLRRKMIDNDVIMMLGHGTENGLIGYGRLIVDSSFVQILRTKICVGIWCNADVFFKRYGLRGLYTGMIISDSDEAETFLNAPFKYKHIEESNKLFVDSIRYSYNPKDIFNLDEILESYKSEYNPIIDFNKINIYSNYLFN